MIIIVIIIKSKKRQRRIIIVLEIKRVPRKNVLLFSTEIRVEITVGLGLKKP